MAASSLASCPLCGASKSREYFNDKRRIYLYCSNCSLVFVPPEYHLNIEDEKRIYDLHENDPYDEGYRRFLSRLAEPLAARLSAEAIGLDFGCGPGPALVKMLEERGFIMSSYDKFYNEDRNALKKSYDFICSTEVVEHFQNPAVEFHRMYGMLNPGGILALMTKMVIDKAAFSKWHYIQDQSHICFYGKKTFEYLAKKYDCTLEFPDRDVIFLHRD
ncbi:MULTISPECIES: class I SAM-dependent methyltransferase [unclassified Oceanispirochaeta]|uniref:class I SAM-dependent methyltransferase n=1 Tax=unclassified Oceanispirochaeta TaxID=2635722 RepID=UPI000E08E0CF|nr:MULTISPECIES: class I SAM-dependent methyltransferase [unclassified Oceanispirochaeta]MBF9015758.1 class I SAM-dependent methyltransferase [Oceanispirochaeta sp. M2]NPD72221.1 class I SAM-dependent methyltransferase [Oceanispirochaeta sp. M1]RDG32319.1 class I SAM-dependent methyltransferase [Oceanispirochaeta sp. M1]